MAIAFVQIATFNGSNVAYPSAQTAGDQNFVFVEVQGTTTAPATPTDHSGNVYTLLANTTSSAVLMAYLYGCFNIAAAGAGVNTITNMSTPSGGTGIIWGAIEYSGVSNTQDGATQTGTGTSTSLATSSLTTTNASDLLICVAAVNGPNITQGTGYTNRFTNATTPNLVMQDQITSSTGSFTGQMTTSSSVFWTELLVAYKAASGGNVTPTATGTLNVSGVQGALSAISPPQATGTMSITGVVTPTITGQTPNPTIVSGPYYWYLIDLLSR